VAELQKLSWLAFRIFYRDQVELTRQSDGKVHRFPIQPRISTDSLYALRNAILTGLGVGIVSSWVVAEDLAQGRLLQLAPEWRAEPLPVYLVYPHARFYPARLRLFIDAIRATMPLIEEKRSAALSGKNR
jgi:DNA-binding transcriptional LysR family regulator